MFFESVVYAVGEFRVEAAKKVKYNGIPGGAHRIWANQNLVQRASRQTAAGIRYGHMTIQSLQDRLQMNWNHYSRLSTIPPTDTTHNLMCDPASEPLCSKDWFIF